MKWYMYRGPFYAILSRFRVVLLGLKGIGEMLGQSSSSSTSTGCTCTRHKLGQHIYTARNATGHKAICVHSAIMSIIIMHVYVHVLLIRGWRPTRASHSPISPELNKFSSTCPKLLVLGGWPLVTRTI